MDYFAHNLFPVWSLTPKLRMAVDEAIRVTQAPPALIASSALAAAALAVQAKYDVRRYNGLVSPTSLYFITFAESGERKTTVDNLFFEPFHQLEARSSTIGNNESAINPDQSSDEEGGGHHG